MAEVEQLSVEDYLRLTEKPHFEFREGAARQKPIPTWLHLLLQMDLNELFAVLPGA